MPAEPRGKLSPAAPSAAAGEEPSAETVALVGVLLQRPSVGVLLRTALLTREDLAALLGISPRGFDRLLATGFWPEPDVRLGRASRWRLTTVVRAVDELRAYPNNGA